MTDATNGSAMLAGNPAGQPAAGTPPGGTPAASTPPGDTGAPPPASGSWYDGFEDAELKGYVQNKGWKDPSELAVGYKNLEKLLGGEKLPMPKGAEDKEGWGRVYDALGRPKAADDYKLPVPEGDKGEFAKAAASKFHELGISQNQAEQLATWWNETQKGQLEQYTTQNSQKVEQEMTALKGEWGQAWDENINLGKRAAQEFGLDQGKLEQLENAWGTKGMLEFMSKIGRGLTEHNFEGGQTTQSFGMTPAAAQDRIKALQADKDFSSKYLTGNADAQAEMARLIKLAYPE